MPRENLSRLQRQWYRRLNDDGFRDIELSAGARDPGAVLDSGRFVDNGPHRSLTVDQLQDGAEYFARARNVLPKLRGVERTVFSLHAEGATFREIARAVGRRLEWVHTTVTRIREREGVKAVNPVKSVAGTKSLLGMVRRMDDETLLEVFGA